MTKAAMRVQIAKDVLALLKKKKISAEHGVYLSTNDPAWDALPVDVNPEKKVEAPKKCEACAIGLCFVAALNRYNDLKIKELSVNLGTVFKRGQRHECTQLSVEREHMVEYLAPWFTTKQLDMIEHAFEGIDFARVSNKNEIARLEEFHRKYAGDMSAANDTVIAIMKNIIKNKGTFKP